MLTAICAAGVSAAIVLCPAFVYAATWCGTANSFMGIPLDAGLVPPGEFALDWPPLSDSMRHGTGLGANCEAVHLPSCHAQSGSIGTVMLLATLSQLDATLQAVMLVTSLAHELGAVQGAADALQPSCWLQAYLAVEQLLQGKMCTADGTAVQA
jgi:hypothetical protein